MNRLFNTYYPTGSLSFGKEHPGRREIQYQLHHVPAVWLWQSGWNFLGFSFLLCKIKHSVEREIHLLLSSGFHKQGFCSNATGALQYLSQQNNVVTTEASRLTHSFRVSAGSPVNAWVSACTGPYGKLCAPFGGKGCQWPVVLVADGWIDTVLSSALVN